MKKLYIAYGSNLNLAQMAARCPSARVYAKGVLNNWELVYRGHKANAHATIIRKRGSTVPVLVWEIRHIRGISALLFQERYHGNYCCDEKESHGLYHG